MKKDFIKTENNEICKCVDGKIFGYHNEILYCIDDCSSLYGEYSIYNFEKELTAEEKTSLDGFIAETLNKKRKEKKCILFMISHCRWNF